MIQQKNHILSRPFVFLSSWRSLPPYELLSYVFMYASVPMLAYGFYNVTIEIIWVVVLTVITLYSGFFAALIWNDITDSEIDAVAHPDRPIPSGRISSTRFFAIAIVFSALTFVFSVMVSIWCFLLVGFTALFTTFHNKYFKHRIQFPAYSEIFTPIQWVTVAIFGYLSIWTVFPDYGIIRVNPSFLGPISFQTSDFYTMIVLVLFTYFAVNAHDLPEGIHDYEGDKKKGVKTYATSFGQQNAARISFFYFILSGLFAFILYFRTYLSPLFLILFVINWIYILSHSYRLVKATEDTRDELAIIAGRKGFDYFLMSYNIIFLDVFIQLIMYYYF